MGHVNLNPSYNLDIQLDVLIEFYLMVVVTLKVKSTGTRRYILFS